MAVYTLVTLEDIARLLASYPIGEAITLQGISEGVENSNYFLETTQGRYILTVYEKRVKKEDLPFYLGLMSHLAGKGIKCPLPVADCQGNYLQDIQGKPAAITHFLEGKSTRRIENWHLEALGEAMASMHKAGQDYAGRITNPFSLASWQSLFARVKPRADEVKKGLSEEIEERLEWLKWHWPKAPLPSGIIHADLFPDNVFFKDHHLSGIIDYYFACHDFLMYDIVISLNAWCFEHGRDFNLTKARRLLSSYHKVRGITLPELEALPVLASGAAMRFLLTRLSDWLNPVEGAMVTPKDPREYLYKLRFHQGVASYKVYGLEG